MRKNLIITASILILVGGAALGWVLGERRKDREETARYESNYNTGTDDFVKQYDEWLQTPPQERAGMPHLLDENGKTKTREQLWQEQRGRLRADLDKLAAGEKTAPPFADLLYGENWHEELIEYQKRKEFQRIVFAGSIVCACVGVAVYAWWLLLWTARLVIKGASALKRLLSRIRSDDAEDEPEAACEEEFLRNRDVDEGQSEPDTAGAEDFLRDSKAGDEQSQPEPRPRISVKPVIPTTVEQEHRPMGSVTQRSTYPMEREKFTVLMSDEKSSDGGASVGGASKPKEPGEKSKPIDNTLTDLTQQVSAIREYAANQQDRLEKLQDGYDWNIIRTFCLRVIRCVDNLETRIDQLNDDDMDVTHLEEVRDELIFALESSGIEQYEPETDSEYRGQEKFAEAVKDKQDCDDPEQAGKIANVIRPGYQYFINEENVKIVRPAQVRLYA